MGKGTDPEERHLTSHPHELAIEGIRVLSTPMGMSERIEPHANGGRGEPARQGRDTARAAKGGMRPARQAVARRSRSQRIDAWAAKRE